VNLTLCREDGLYHPGEILSARWRISRVPLEQVQGLEVSVLWHTEGKGDEDFRVHHFHRQGEQQLRRSGLSDARSTHCELPATPLSYQGKLISVCWCVRLRLFLAGGREILTQQPFYLIHPAMVCRTDVIEQQSTGSPLSQAPLSQAALNPSWNGDTETTPDLQAAPSVRSHRQVRRFAGSTSAT
jgi:hypothetical protein